MKITKIKKRDGRIVDFEQKKITEAIFKALTATGQGDGKKAKGLSDKVVEILNRRFKEKEIPTVEQIQDIVEEVLILENLVETAKAYILYREQRRRIREAVKFSEEAVDRIDQYLEKLDWEIQENANMAFSLQGLNHYGTSYIVKKYWLNKIYPKEIREANESGDFHLHNLDTLGPYTFFGREVVIAKLNKQIKLISLKDLYEQIPQAEILLNEKDQAFAKYPEDLLILDKNGWTKVTRMVRKKKDREMRFIKSEQGRSIIVTDNHPFIVKRKNKEIEIEAKEVKEKQDLIYSADIPSLLKSEALFSKKYLYLAQELLNKNYQKFFLEGFEWQDFIRNWGGNLKVEGTLSTSNSANSLNNKLELTEDLGYLVGLFIAEGNYSSWRLVITTSEEKMIEKVKRICAKLGVRVYVRIKERTKNLCLSCSTLKLLFEKVFQIKTLSKNKNLPVDILTYNLDFIKGVIAGIIDGEGTVQLSDKSHNQTQILIRVSSRTMLEQIAILLQFLGLVPRDGITAEDIGKKHYFKNKEIIQNYPIYRLSFSKKAKVNLPSFKYQEAATAKFRWRSEEYGWNKVLNNKITTISDDFIYDITTNSNTFLCNALLVHNCMGWDLYDLLLKGFGGVAGKVEAKPPKHFHSALGQVVNFMYTLQGECYSKDTQVLTDSGWKYFWQVNKEDKVFTLNNQTNEIELQKPIRFYEYDYNDYLYNFKSKKIDLLVTPNHNLFTNNLKKGKYEFIKAKNFNPEISLIPISNKNFTKVKLEKISKNPGIKKIKYYGKVYCLEVPNHTLYVRREGKACWCGNCAGAIAFSNFDTLLAPFIRYDNLNYQQVKQALQEFLFCMATPTRVGFQSPFTNITLDLKPSPVFAKFPVIIGGKPQKETYQEFEEEMKIFNKAFYEVMLEGDKAGRPFHFPIPTINITKDFPWQEPAFDGIFEASAKYGANYFANYIQSDMKPEDVRSMCCLTGDTPLLFKNDNQIHYLPAENLATRGEIISEVSNNQIIWKRTKNLEILSIDEKGNSCFVPVKNILIKNYQGQIIKFVLEDGTEIKLTPDHPCFVVKHGKILEKKAENLSQNDYLLITKGYSKAIKNPKKEILFKGKILNLDYDFGRFVGLFLAEGMKFTKHYGVAWCFGDTEKELIEFIKNFLINKLHLKYWANHHSRDKTVYISCRDKDLFYLLRKDFGTNELAKEKNLGEKIFDSPAEFRLGVIRGFLEGDGYKRNKKDGGKEISFHIASYKLAVGLRNLLKSLNINSSIRKQQAKNPRNPKQILDSWSVNIVTEDFKYLKINKFSYSTKSRWYALSPKEIGIKREDIKTYNQGRRLATRETFDKGKRIHPEILLRDLRNFSGLFNLFLNSDLYCKRITKIKKEKYKGFVYDVEVEASHSAFQLPNGVVTHNCRLRLDLTELYNRGGGGLFGSGSKTGSIGVVTINLPRIGYLSKTKKEFFERLEKILDLAKESLEIKRKVIENFIEKGLYPYSKFYLQDIKKMRGAYYGNHFSTIGLVGMNEALLNFLGKDIGSKEGRKFALEVLDFMREKLVKYQKETENIYNLEATPAESSLAPNEKVLISQSDPKLIEIGPLIDKYLEKNKEKVQIIGNSEVLPLPNKELFTYGFSRKDQKIKKYPVTALIRHPGNSLYEIITNSGRRVKVTKYHSVFTLGRDGVPREIKVEDLKKGQVIAIPKKIKMENQYFEFNLIEEFKKDLENRDKLYLKTTSNLIEKLILDERVKKWAENYYAFNWKDVKCSWKKRKVIPLKMIYDLNINLDRKILENSMFFYRKNKNTFKIKSLIKVNRDLGFLIGIILAEGWIGKDKIEIANTEEKIIKEIASKVKKVFGSDSYYLSLKDKRKYKSLFVLTLGKMITLFFKDILKMKGKSNKKLLPSFVYFASDNFVAGLLKGFAIGDGYWYSNDKKRDYTFRLYTNSKELMEGLNILLLKLGILAKIRIDRKEKCNPLWKRNYILSISGIENLKRFFKLVFGQEFRGKLRNSGRDIIPAISKPLKLLMKKFNINTKELRKLKIHKDSFNRNVRANRITRHYLKEILEKLEKKVKDPLLKNLRILINGDLYWDPIKSIKKIKTQKYVYDFQVNVDGDLVENFLGGEGLVCLHNTAYRLAQKDKEKYPEIITAGTKEVPYYTNCVSEDTEILTDKGWTSIDEIREDERVLTYNVKRQLLEYKPILNIYKYPKEKRKMIRIQHKYVDLLLTPNHFVLYSPRGAPHKEVFTFANNLNEYFNIRVAAEYKCPENKKFSDDFLKLIGWIVSEGHFETDNAGIRLHQTSNPGYVLEIRETLKNLDINFREWKDTIFSWGKDREETFFRIPAEIGKKIREVIDKKEIPREILNEISPRQAEILIETIVKGDGTRYRTYSVVNTSNPNLANQLMELAMKAGHYVAVHDYRDLRGVFHIVISNTKRRVNKHQISKEKHVKEVEYEGRVWCVETENRTIVVRRKVGNSYKYCITGNSTMLPVNYTDDPFEALRLQDELQCKYSGGTVLHLFLGERISDIETVKKLIKKIFENFHLPYITLTPTFSICPVHGYLAGEHFECPKCTIKQPCEVYSRIVGYYRPVQQYNIGKQQEFKERKTFKIKE